jgi:hypothetical protein
MPGEISINTEKLAEYTAGLGTLQNYSEFTEGPVLISAKAPVASQGGYALEVANLGSDISALADQMQMLLTQTIQVMENAHQYFVEADRF